ncbi:MAG TPA: hypothetical protein VFD35_12330 [Pricia sp.]|nr:hypothetical protein [Pricia sp.]
MTRDQIDHIIDTKAVPHPTDGIKLSETHISWVVLTDHYVYKIKKPVKFDFLDFSTLEKRKYYCEQEVKLNQRLAPSMYLGILPINRSGNAFKIEDNPGEVIDHAVLMKRMDGTKQLDLLLDNENVKTDAIIKLADKVSSFHQKAAIVPEGRDWKEIYREFEDIKSVQDFFVRHFDEAAGQFIEELDRQAYQFLKANKERIAERNKSGFVIDGHGDLHTRNIFLLEEPVIFDCIEFNEDLRKLDKLNEIAFLCMDLERYGRFDLSKVFIGRYLSKMDAIENKTDERLFLFYKLYRANVRMKIHAIEARAADSTDEQREKDMELIRRYLELCKRYSKELKSTG